MVYGIYIYRLDRIRRTFDIVLSQYIEVTNIETARARCRDLWALYRNEAHHLELCGDGVALVYDGIWQDARA